MVALGGGAVSYERGTPLLPTPCTLNPDIFGSMWDPKPYTLNPNPAPCTLSHDPAPYTLNPDAERPAPEILFSSSVALA